MKNLNVNDSTISDNNKKVLSFNDLDPNDVGYYERNSEGVVITEEKVNKDDNAKHYIELKEVSDKPDNKGYANVPPYVNPPINYPHNYNPNVMNQNYYPPQNDPHSRPPMYYNPYAPQMFPPHGYYPPPIFPPVYNQQQHQPQPQTQNERRDDFLEPAVPIRESLIEKNSQAAIQSSKTRNIIFGVLIGLGLIGFGIYYILKNYVLYIKYKTFAYN